MDKKLKSTIVSLLVLSLVLSLVLVGCGPNQSNDSNDADVKYPVKPIEFIVGWGVGGGTDIFIRTITIPAQDILDVGIAVVNKPGAAGSNANTYVQQKKADGYTIINANPGLISNHLIGRDEISYKDFIPVIRAQFEPGTWVTTPEGKYQTIEEVIEFAKANPEEIKLAGAGALGLDDISSKMFMMEAGIELTYVPFDTTSEMHAALLGGHVDLMYEEPSVAMPLIEANKIKPIIVFNDKKLDVFPETPAAGEMGYEVPPGTWRGIAVKKGTPDEIVKELERVFTEAMQDEYYTKYEKSSLLDLTPGYQSGEEFGKLWESENEKYSKILDKLGLLKVEQ